MQLSYLLLPGLLEPHLVKLKDSPSDHVQLPSLAVSLPPMKKPLPDMRPPTKEFSESERMLARWPP